MLLLLSLSLLCRRSFDPEIPSTTPLSESMTAFSQQCGIGVWRTRRRQRQRKRLLMASRSSATLLLSFFLSFMPLVCSFSQIKVSNISKRSIFRATLSVDDVGDLDSDDKRRKDRQQLQIAFVTGNAMKVCSFLEMVLRSNHEMTIYNNSSLLRHHNSDRQTKSIAFWLITAQPKEKLRTNRRLSI